MLAPGNDRQLNGLHLCEAAIHERFRSRDIAAVVGCENITAFAISSAVPNLPSETVLEIIFARCSPVCEETSRSLSPGVSMKPGLTAFTRMRRSFKSVVNVRAKRTLY
jgi:hypothetical protein